MAYEMGADGERRLEQFFDKIGEVLGSSQRRASFAAYAMGLLSESERKSIVSRPRTASPGS
jgi:SRSO17 transposase